MKYIAKKCALILTLLSFGLLTNAQKGNLSGSPIIGVSKPIFDSGLGFHIGVNPSYSLSSNFSLEGQLSYSYTEITSSFLSGKTGQSNSTNILMGGRLYLNSEERPNRFYLNLLVGGNYIKEEGNGVKYDGEINMGISSGGFFELGKFLIGLSYETPQNLILKIGYVFNLINS